MTIQVTPEVASAHRNLEKLCEKFETCVDEFCALPLQSLRTKNFYESECVPTAVECVEALSKFESARSYEVAAYERTVAQAGDTLRQRKRKLEVNIVQRAKAYEGTVAQVDETLRQQLHKFEEHASQRIEKTYEHTVAEANNTFNQQKRELEGNANQRIQDIEYEVQEVGVDFTFSEEEAARTNSSKIPSTKALARAKRAVTFSQNSKKFKVILAVIGAFIYWAIRVGYLGAYNAWDSEVARALGQGICLGAIILVLVSWAWKRGNRRALWALRFAALAECNMIREDMEAAMASAIAERDKKFKDAQTKQREARQAAATEAEVNLSTARRDRDAKVKAAWEKKERKDKQDAEAEMKALATRDKKVEEADLKRNQAIAYIQQEYKAFDTCLCQCLDKFEQFVEAWTTEHTDVTFALRENRVQNSSENDGQITPYLTRVGTVGIWA